MKTLASLLPDQFKMALLKRHLARDVADDRLERTRLTIVDRPNGTSPLCVSFSKVGSTIEVAIDATSAMNQPSVYRLLYARLPAVLSIFSRTGAPVRTFDADLSDGNNAPAGAMAFCSNRDDVILVPDPVFVNSNGYAEYRNKSFAHPWADRDDMVLWRGTLTGKGVLTTELMAANDAQLRQRTRMCLILRSTPKTDVKIRKAEGKLEKGHYERLAGNGLLGGKIRQSDWGRQKFALDVDGHTNAWSNFYVRLLLGCCVIKISSEGGFRQWYYDKLVPWRHFVPVRADMSDLIEKIDWCRAHDEKCRNIAKAGKAVASSMTASTEINDAVRRLEAAIT